MFVNGEEVWPGKKVRDERTGKIVTWQAPLGSTDALVSDDGVGSRRVKQADLNTKDKR